MAKEDIVRAREEKVQLLRNEGINPYPREVTKITPLKEIKGQFSDFDGKEVTLAGRILNIRQHGGVSFLNFSDGGAFLQAMLNKKELGDKEYKHFFEIFDPGDIITVTGKLFITKTGEQTIEVKKYQILSKALLAMPDQWFGLKNVEDRIRKRYIDLNLNFAAKDKFIKRAKIIQAIRDFLNSNEFVEVETPVLQPIYGGAAAEPFKTHLNALDVDVFLRIAPELYLKRLIVGGFQRVYELSKNFRNEGVDFAHNPEFTFLEFYYAYQDDIGLLNFTEQLLSSVVKNVFGAYEVEYQGHKLNFKPPFKVVEFFDELEKKFGENFEEKTKEELATFAKKLFINTENKTRAKLLDDIFKHSITSNTMEPFFVVHQPLALTPLAKSWEKNPKRAARFQFFAGGFELANAFSELNDPHEQEKRFQEEGAKQKEGDKESHPFDADFVEALMYGMPPTAGLGMGIDRLVALLTDSTTIRDVILFPFLRQK